jgi:F0F1-type ATP synthase membrane subunit c/vacuolar-type H+-ATPase subunit K
MKPNLVAHYQILLIIWVSLLVSQLLFIAIVVLTKPNLFRFDLSQNPLEPSGAMILGFAVAAVTCVVLSFAFKRRLYERAVEAQDPAQVQSGLIIALALCEASSLFGLVLAFAFDYPYFFLWFALGVVGMLLHFPKQNDLIAAGYKQK